jgi:hypothetical protein
MVIPKLNIKGKPQRTIKKIPSKFTHKKHDIAGYATRVMPHSHDTYSSSFIPPTTRTRTPTPKHEKIEELMSNTPTQTTPTPLTPRGKIFKDILEENKKKNKKIRIVETFVPDEDDIEKKQERMELGIKSPDAYFTENVLKSLYTNKIGKKRNLSDMFDANEQLELDDEWFGKPDDPGGIPHQVQATTTIKRRQPFGRNNRRNRSRRRTRNRTRNRTRSRTRSRN